MRLGAWLPTTEFSLSGTDLLAYARTVHGFGYSELVSSDHPLTTVLPDGHPMRGTLAQGYHDPLLAFATLAPQTGLDFATSVLILPLRPAVMVAKQMADLVWTFGDRFRIGVSSGWNAPEFEALGVPFAERGAIVAEQVEVICALWPGNPIDYDGAHHLHGVGIRPAGGTDRPPLWFGGTSSRVLDRIVRFGDGWIPASGPDDQTAATLAQLRERTTAAGRDPATIGLEGALSLTTTDVDDDLLNQVDRWRALGATHLTVRFEGGGFRDIDEVLPRLERLARVIGG